MVPYLVFVVALLDARALISASSGSPLPNRRFLHRVRLGGAPRHDLMVLQNGRDVASWAMQGPRCLRMRRTPGRVFLLGGSEIGSPVVGF